jgi:hypothetical protein
MYFEVVESLRNVGGYACEAIDYEQEGVGTIVEFYAANSKELADEYAAWKNGEVLTGGEAHDQSDTSRSMKAGSTHF